MKLIDAIKNVKRPLTDDRSFDHCPFEELCRELCIEPIWDVPEELEHRLGCYPIFNWMCTDEHVGLDALYLDGEPMGMVYRPARKCGYVFKWLNCCAEKVQAVILSYVDRDGDFDIIDPDTELPDFANVDYAGQALTDDGFYEGRPVKALVWYDQLMGRSTPVEYRREGRSYTEAVPYGSVNGNCVLVQDGDDQVVIPIEEFMIPLNVNLEGDK